MDIVGDRLGGRPSGREVSVAKSAKRLPLPLHEGIFAVVVPQPLVVSVVSPRPSPKSSANRIHPALRRKALGSSEMSGCYFRSHPRISPPVKARERVLDRWALQFPSFAAATVGSAGAADR